MTNAGTLELATSTELPSITNTGGTIQVDTGDTLTLQGGTITGGTINNGTPITGATISIVGSSAIENASLDNGAVTIASWPNADAGRHDVGRRYDHQPQHHLDHWHGQCGRTPARR